MEEQSGLAQQRGEALETVLREITGTPTSALRERAVCLVRIAKCFSVPSYVPSTRDEPLLASIRVEDWDFILTVALVFVAMTELNKKVPPAIGAELIDLVSEAMDRWNKNAGRGFEDCQKFFDSVYDDVAEANRRQPEWVSCDAVGLWAAWNLLNRRPETTEELRVSRRLGLLSHSLLGVWD